MQLSEYLKTNGLTARAFAARVGVSTSGVRKWLYGDRVPSGKALVRLVEVTEGKVRPEDFIAGQAVEPEARA